MGTSLQVTDLLGRQRIARGRPGILLARRSQLRWSAAGGSRDQSAHARRLGKDPALRCLLDGCPCVPRRVDGQSVRRAA
jgi:hypothetical protein